jgi:hypothetical protein
LEDGNGNAQDLTGATLKLLVQDSQDASKTLALNGSMVIDSPTGGICHYVPGSTDFPVPGTFLAQIQATYSGSGIVITWPTFQIVVNPVLPQSNN